ncbi:hypothetical protein L195_g055855, partial [Trifolium pratense]
SNSLIDEIRELNSDTPWWLPYMSSTTTLESLSKTVLDQPLEIASRIASIITVASPSAAVNLWILLFVLAATKEPSESLTHHPF